MVALHAEEVDRILGVPDRILADGRPFLAGDSSLADIMHGPWLAPVLALEGPQLVERKRLVAWLRQIEARPAIRAAPR